VKYRDGCVPLERLKCTETQSSFVHQVCYDAENNYMIILLRDTRKPLLFYPSEIVTALIRAISVGRYYNEEIKGRFGCQGLSAPSY
jgi:hypothetical protein